MNAPVMRASAALRWVNCPEAAWLEPQYPDNEGEAAREGTAAHEMAELVLTGKFTIEELVNRQASNGVIMIDEMVEHVLMYVEHVQSRGVAFWVEESILIENPAIMAGKVTGRCDGAAFAFDDTSGMLYIDDFKYGMGLVEIFENWQQLVYAIGMNQKIDRVVKNITMSIIQPRGHHHDGHIRSWTITEAELIRYTKILVERVNAVMSPDRQCHTGMHCRYCKAHAFCAPAIAAGWNAVDVTMNALPDTTTPEQVAVLIDELTHASKTIKHLLDAVNGRGEKMILGGQPVPGYSVLPGKGNTAFINEDEAIATAKCFGVDITKTATVTPAEAKRRKLPDAVYESLTYRPSTSPRLVKMNITSFRKVFENA